ncbi:hypothetical protein [Phocaeicola vulgatus]|uniref:hypothetical protein n=1 Tax=Phocaeicola vulgatus TaxID=821 RepID=UPI001EDD1B37|nr:hypothetical protein [Phocaeicola vulgatus]MCG4726081.1 hypothetical protein [Phocaeicola vulgatus]
MSVLKQTEKIRSIVVSVLCRKNRRFQSEPVFVMERCREKENNLTRVLLTEIFTNGLCLVTYPCYNEEQQSLSDICLDSLLRLLYLVEPEFDFTCSFDDYGVYAYPVSRFSCDASDEDIISDYMNNSNDEDPVRKYTIEEFLSYINDECFNDLGYWVRLLR